MFIDWFNTKEVTLLAIILADKIEHHKKASPPKTERVYSPKGLHRFR